ncbi:MAG: hypothetical protein FJZ57_05190, partial [Chlamydiae bacterium]|nr:hypothetical protein [Chlamydiota bacterium]
MVNSVFLSQNIEELSHINRSNTVKALSPVDVEKVKSVFATLSQDPISTLLSSEVAKLAERVEILHETNRLTLGRNTIGLVIDLFKKFELSLLFANFSDKSKRQLVNWVYPLVKHETNPIYREGVLDLVLRAPIKDRREVCSNLEALISLFDDQKYDVIFRLKGVPEDELCSSLQVILGLITHGCSAKDVYLLLDFFEEIDFIDINLLSDFIRKIFRIVNTDRFSYPTIGIEEKIHLMKVLQFSEEELGEDILSFISTFKGDIENVDQIVSLVRMKGYLDEEKQKNIIEFKDVIFPLLKTSEDKIGFVLLFEYIPNDLCNEFFSFYIQYLLGQDFIEPPFSILERFLATKSENIADFHDHLEERIRTFESPMLGLYFMSHIWLNKEKFMIQESSTLHHILLLLDNVQNYLFSLPVGRAQGVFCSKYDFIVSLMEDEEGLEKICDQINSIPFNLRGELLHQALILSEYAMNALELRDLLEIIASIPLQYRWEIVDGCKRIIKLSSHHQPLSIQFLKLLANDVDFNDANKLIHNII